MFVIKDDDGKNDHKSYKSIYFNYFLICSNRVKLFLAMQMRVMAACMESQSNIRSAQSRPRDGRGVSDVCVNHSLVMSEQNTASSSISKTMNVVGQYYCERCNDFLCTVPI